MLYEVITESIQCPTEITFRWQHGQNATESRYALYPSENGGWAYSDWSQDTSISGFIDLDNGVKEPYVLKLFIESRNATSVSISDTIRNNFV